MTTTTMLAPSGVGGQIQASKSGTVYTIDKNGYVAVNPVDVVALEQAGFVVIPLVSAFSNAKYSTAALQATVIPAANLVGGLIVVFENTGTTPGNLQLDTAANIIAAIPNAQVGQSYLLKVRNSSGSSNTATLTTNTGLTLHGTMTIAQNVTRDLLVVLTSLSVIDIYSVGLSAAGA